MRLKITSIHWQSMPMESLTYSRAKPSINFVLSRVSSNGGSIARAALIFISQYSGCRSDNSGFGLLSGGGEDSDRSIIMLSSVVIVVKNDGNGPKWPFPLRNFRHLSSNMDLLFNTLLHEERFLTAIHMAMD